MLASLGLFSVTFGGAQLQCQHRNCRTRGKSLPTFACGRLGGRRGDYGGRNQCCCLHNHLRFFASGVERGQRFGAGTIKHGGQVVTTLVDQLPQTQAQLVPRPCTIKSGGLHLGFLSL